MRLFCGLFIVLISFSLISFAKASSIGCEDNAPSAINLLQEQINKAWRQSGGLLDSPAGDAAELQLGHGIPKSISLIGTVTVDSSKNETLCKLMFNILDKRGNLIQQSQAVFTVSAMNNGQAWIEFQK